MIHRRSFVDNFKRVQHNEENSENKIYTTPDQRWGSDRKVHTQKIDTERLYWLNMAEYL